MRVNFIRVLCVNQCLLDSTLVGNSLLIHIVLNRDPTKCDLSRTWLWLFSRAGAQYITMKVFTQQEHNRKLTASMLMDFALTVAQILGLLDASIISPDSTNFNRD